MSEEREARVKAVFLGALDVPPPDRRAYLDRVCEGDSALRLEVEELLAHESRCGFLTPPGNGVSLGAFAAPLGAEGPRPGDRIDRYTLVERLGEGGFGVVYLAEQTEPVRRRVALKVIKPGMDSRAVIARFEAERQALAVMDHPNVARVLDAGATERGLPYFVMEHVPGEPITSYCDARSMPVRVRLELFIDVCEAVQHAHLKGIIHRDIKPGNILVRDGERGPVVKVIDFGVAKALAPTPSRETLFTEQGQLIGTPEYMSPEQAAMGSLDIDTRTDVYSLGVVLYELLTGSLPFDAQRLRSGGFDELRRTIREVEPPRPSTRCSRGAAGAAEAARRRHTGPDELASLLRRELEWIPLKAMRKDRAQRYRTPSEMADDIRNYLGGRSLLAGPETASYRVRKFIRRNRAGVIAVLAMAALLLGGIAGTGYGLVRAEARRVDAVEALGRAMDAEQESAARARDLERVAAFQAAQLSSIDAAAMGERIRERIIEERTRALGPHGTDEQAARQALRGLESELAGVNFTDVALDTLSEHVFGRALAAIDDRFGDQPLVRASLLQTAASTMREVGLHEVALAPQTTALEIRRERLGTDHPDTLASVNSLGLLLHSRGLLAEAEPFYREALAGRERSLGSDHPDTLSTRTSLGVLLWMMGRHEEGVRLTRDTVEGLRRTAGTDNPDTLAAIGNLGGMLHMLGDLDGAEPHLRESAEGYRRVLGEAHQSTLIAASNHGRLLLDLGRASEAEACLRGVVETSRRVLGDAHPATLTSINNLGGMFWALGRLDEAEACFREAIDLGLRGMGESHPDTLNSIHNMGGLLWEMGRPDEAERHFRQALDGLRRVLGDDHPETLNVLGVLCRLLAETGRQEEADALSAEFGERIGG
ncbi:MAG TPA: serine/threonine-protein kinase [Phycisphaerales bacterium]|nr:serine/threonine-protein kinase [Phycisphaerales bacterium]